MCFIVLKIIYFFVSKEEMVYVRFKISENIFLEVWLVCIFWIVKIKVI